MTGMRRFEECLNPLYDAYREAFEWTKANLKAKVLPASSGFYFFLWLGDEWKGLPSEVKVKRMLDAGVVLSPGEAFGNMYDGWARMCFTILPPEELKEAVGRINEMIK